MLQGFILGIVAAPVIYVFAAIIGFALSRAVGLLGTSVSLRSRHARMTGNVKEAQRYLGVPQPSTPAPVARATRRGAASLMMATIAAPIATAPPAS